MAELLGIERTYENGFMLGVVLMCFIVIVHDYFKS